MGCLNISSVTDPASPPSDEVLDALQSLVTALGRNVDASGQAIAQARTIAELRAQGLAYREIVDEAGTAMVVQLVTENLERLRVHGAQLRQAQATALHDEGMTMEEIATVFGVTRQRISALIRSSRGD